MGPQEVLGLLQRRIADNASIVRAKDDEPECSVVFYVRRCVREFVRLDSFFESAFIEWLALLFCEFIELALRVLNDPSSCMSRAAGLDLASARVSST